MVRARTNLTNSKPVQTVSILTAFGVILQLKPEFIRDELIVVSVKGTKAGLRALQCAPSPWTRWRKHLMGDTVK